MIASFSAIWLRVKDWFRVHGDQGLRGVGAAGNGGWKMDRQRRRDAAALRQVVHQLGDHLAPGLIDQLPTCPMATEQADLLERVEMKRQRGQRQPEPFPHLTGGLGSGLDQMAENLQTGVLRERAEHGDGG
jgi:hypothetical protein